MITQYKNLLLKFSGFSIVGLFVTLSSLLLIYIFIGVLETPLYLSYIVIYAFSIFISYLLNLKYVFRMNYSTRRTLTYFLIYGSSMIIGIITLKIYHLILPLKDWLQAYLVIPITLSWNFIMLSIFLKR